MSWMKAIEQEFQDCLKFFPELRDCGIKLMVQPSDCLAGLKARAFDRPLLILLVPSALQADEKSKEL